MLLLSSLTDAVDGAVARRFRMTSALGKVLDPVADKMTQGAMLLCLFSRFPLMLIPLSEIFIRTTGILSVWKIAKRAPESYCHGKEATFMLYAMLIVHMAWCDIPMWISVFLVGACMTAVLLF